MSPHQSLARQLPLKGKPGAVAGSSSFAKKPSPRGEGGTAAAVTDEVGRESLRQPIRSAAEKTCCIIRGGRTLNFGASVGGLRLRGANSFIITAVKLWRGRDATSSVACATASPQGEARGARAYREKEPSFLRIEKIAKKNGENRLTEANAFSII